jgi:hypothetical protein
VSNIFSTLRQRDDHLRLLILWLFVNELQSHAFLSNDCQNSHSGPKAHSEVVLCHHGCADSTENGYSSLNPMSGVLSRSSLVRAGVHSHSGPQTSIQTIAKEAIHAAAVIPGAGSRWVAKPAYAPSMPFS